MASGGHLGFVEFLDFDQCNTDTRVIPLIPLILGQKSVSGVEIMFGEHLDAKSKMAAKITSWICGESIQVKNWRHINGESYDTKT